MSFAIINFVIFPNMLSSLDQLRAESFCSSGCGILVVGWSMFAV